MNSRSKDAITVTSEMLAKAADAATANRKKVERLAGLLADAMKEIHGGEWRIQIEHEVEVAMVVVVPRPDRRSPPMREVA